MQVKNVEINFSLW